MSSRWLLFNGFLYTEWANNWAGKSEPRRAGSRPKFQIIKLQCILNYLCNVFQSILPVCNSAHRDTSLIIVWVVNSSSSLIFISMAGERTRIVKGCLKKFTELDTCSGTVLCFLSVHCHSKSFSESLKPISIWIASSPPSNALWLFSSSVFY